MLILIINQHSIFALKSECQAPVSIHPKRPMTFKVTFECIQLPAGNIHIFRRNRSIKSSQLSSQLLCMLCLNASIAAGLKKLFIANSTVKCNYILINHHQPYDERLCFFHAHIEFIAQGVTEKVHGHDQREENQAGPDNETGGDQHQTGAFADHRAK
ncbi:hypothetical protein MMIC_P0923 [Mariprofundus micogutta]|uniref:Uncharacterized protein n=1 Tax=Mariprofundus micogutta TaxID=1921010 RepID=A0A1L8CM24_9PROT|nr:hypothetical protein MMIC_P0923 [Mariprofundus micogutta]